MQKSGYFDAMQLRNRTSYKKVWNSLALRIQTSLSLCSAILGCRL